MIFFGLNTKPSCPMAFSKAILYGKRERKVSVFANALAHPARIVILTQLRFGELKFSELLEKHPLNRASLSQHLRTLRLAGLVDCSVIGTLYYYSIAYDKLPQWVLDILSDLENLEHPKKAA